VVARCRQLLVWLRRHPGRVLAAFALLVLLGLGGYYAARQVRAGQHYRAAEQALDRRDYRQAARDLDACLQVWPDDAAARFLAGRAARLAGEFDRAEEHLRACQRRQGVTRENSLEWALLQAQRDGLNDWEDDLRSRLAQDDPDALWILDVLTGQLLHSRRLLEARGYLDQWLQRRPDDPLPLVRRGWVAEHLFDDGAALADYQRALAVNPADDNVRLRVAEILERTRYGDEALAHYEDLRRRQPDNPDVLLGLVRCRHQLGQEAEARQLLDALAAEHPDDTRVLAERGRLALAAGDAAEAERWLRRAAERAPHDRQINYGLYEALHRLGKTEEARQVNDRLKRLEEDEQRMAKIAREILRRPHDAGLRYEGGMIFLRNGLTEDGLDWLHTALQEDPGHRPTHLALAEYYEQHGRADLAARHRALAQLPAGDGAPEPPQ
jgi:tetratricopeptide (TPR) repeat protein